jgi:hypothetical protein
VPRACCGTASCGPGGDGSGQCPSGQRAFDVAGGQHGEHVRLQQRHDGLERGQHDGEVARLVALGATRIDIGQTGAEPFTVLADPEGNEFCVLHRGDRR